MMNEAKGVFIVLEGTDGSGKGTQFNRLAERLKGDGSDVDGWLRLVRAYTVLGERERALSALADARRALGQDADKLRRLDELSKELKLES